MARRACQSNTAMHIHNTSDHRNAVVLDTSIVVTGVGKITETLLFLTQLTTETLLFSTQVLLSRKLENHWNAVVLDTTWPVFALWFDLNSQSSKFWISSLDVLHRGRDKFKMYQKMHEIMKKWVFRGKLWHFSIQSRNFCSSFIYRPVTKWRSKQIYTTFVKLILNLYQLDFDGFSKSKDTQKCDKFVIGDVRNLLVRRLGYELDDEVLDYVDALRVRVLVVAEAVHHATQLLAEQPLTAVAAEHQGAVAALLLVELRVTTTNDVQLRKCKGHTLQVNVISRGKM